MDDAAFEAELDAVLVGGREKRNIDVVPYDRAWPQRFETERARITAAVGVSADAVHHIGSTSVEGLAAKPIIDILLVVPDPDLEETYLPALEREGYVLRVREDDHRMFRTPERDVHIHIWSDHADDERHLLFRDWLRHCPEDRVAYEALKLRLAREDWEDMNYYTRAKSDLVEEIMGRAGEWARTGRPTGR